MNDGRTQPVTGHMPFEGHQSCAPDDAPVALVRFLADGELELYAFGREAPEFRFIVIDERCPDDRVYAVTGRHPLSALNALVPPGSTIGHRHDGRHEALLARIESAIEGRPHLAAVEPST